MLWTEEDDQMVNLSLYIYIYIIPHDSASLKLLSVEIYKKVKRPGSISK